MTILAYVFHTVTLHQDSTVREKNIKMIYASEIVMENVIKIFKWANCYLALTTEGQILIKSPGLSMIKVIKIDPDPLSDIIAVQFTGRNELKIVRSDKIYFYENHLVSIVRQLDSPIDIYASSAKIWIAKTLNNTLYYWLNDGSRSYKKICCSLDAYGAECKNKVACITSMTCIDSTILLLMDDYTVWVSDNPRLYIPKIFRPTGLANIVKMISTVDRGFILDDKKNMWIWPEQSLMDGTVADVLCNSQTVVLVMDDGSIKISFSSNGLFVPCSIALDDEYIVNISESSSSNHTTYLITNKGSIYYVSGNTDDGYTAAHDPFYDKHLIATPPLNHIASALSVL